MAAPKRYDVIFADTSPGSLAAAACLGHSGVRVFLYDDGADSPPRDGNHPFLFPEVEKGSVMEELFRLADVPLAERRNFRPPQTILQAVFPGCRIDVKRERNAFLTELARELPGDLSRYEAFYEEMAGLSAALRTWLAGFSHRPPTRLRERLRARCFLGAGLRSWRGTTLSAYARERGLEAPFLTLVTAQLRALGHLYLDDPHIFQVALTLGDSCRGRTVAEGGYGRFKSLLLERLAERGVEIRRGKPLDEPEHLPDKFWRARLPGGGVVEAPFFAGGYLAPGEKVRPLFKVNVDVSIPRDGVPVGMAKRVVYVRDPGAPLEGDNLLLVTREDLFDEFGRDTGVKLRVSAYLEKPPVEGAPLKEWGTLVLRRLGEFMPFVEEHLEKLDPTGAAPGQAVFREPPGLFRGLSHYSLRGRPLRCCRGVLPALGFEGELIAGRDLAAYVAAKLAR